MKTQKPQRISQAELAAVAAQGVSRALAARESRLRELTPQEQAEISGGGASMLISKIDLVGGRLHDLHNPALKSQLTVPTLDMGAMDLGMTRMV